MVEEKMCSWPNQQANSDATNANYTIAHLHYPYQSQSIPYTLLHLYIKQERREEALTEICITIESKKNLSYLSEVGDLDELDELAELETKLFRFIVAWYKMRQDKPNQASWVLYDNSSMHHNKSGSLYPSRAATRWAEMRWEETSRDKKDEPSRLIVVW